jgi:ribA/ribD-fused uncharacterized protein
VNHVPNWSWVSNFDLAQAGAHDPAGGAPRPAAAGPAHSSSEVVKFYSNKNADVPPGQKAYYELTNYWDRKDHQAGVEIDRHAHSRGNPGGILIPDIPARRPTGGPDHVQYLFHDGIRWWKSAEHRFQVHKCLEGPDRQRLWEASKNMGTAFSATGIGPKWAWQEIGSKGLERPDWVDVKMKVMYNTLLFKFNRNEYCKQVLCGTRGKLLIENAGDNDGYWGDGAAKASAADWNISDFKPDTWNQNKPAVGQRGYNWLGLLLMQIRDLVCSPGNYCITKFGRLPLDVQVLGINRDGYFHDTDGSIF